jgi:SprT protein
MGDTLKFKQILSKYLPNDFVPYISELIIQSEVKFKIVAPRRTKLGDFKAKGDKSNKSQITINGDLNPFAFLITTLHELAHLYTYNKYKCKVRPHGKEWKKEFSILLNPILIHDALPNELKIALKKSIQNLKASSCSDIHLSRALKKYDPSKRTVTLEELDENTRFAINKKTYLKGKLRRTRYLCKEMSSGKSYLIHALAEVNKLE